MRIIKKRQTELDEIELEIRYGQEDNRFNKLIRLLETFDKQLDCYQDQKRYLINVSDIYYIESVDKKTFVYLKEQVYQTDNRLYQLLEDLEGHGFIQINKSCLLNSYVLEHISPLFNSRMEATLKNGEKLIINRRFLKDVKSALKGEKG